MSDLPSGHQDRCMHCGSRLGRRRLTPAQRAVYERCVRGASNKEIADELGLTEKKIKGHLYGIFQKANVDSRAKLIVGHFAKTLPIDFALT